MADRQQLPEVGVDRAPTPYSNVDYRPNAAALGQGVERLGAGIEAAQQQVERAQALADHQRAAAEHLKLEDTIEQESVGKDGFLTRQGEAALDPTKNLETIEKKRSQITQGLANERQRAFFNERAQASVRRAQFAFDKHSHDQSLVVGDATAKANEQKALAYAGANPADEEGIDARLALAKKDALAHLIQIGAPKEAVAAKMGDLEQKVYGETTKSLLASGNGVGAQAFFEKHRGQFGTDTPTLTRAVQEGGDAHRAESIASSIVAKARDPETKWIDPGAAIEHVERIPDSQPKIKEHARRVVEDAITKDAMVRKYQGEQILQKGLALYLNGASLDGPQMAEIKAKMTDPKNVGWGAEWNKLVNEDARKRSEGRRDAAESRLEAAERRRQEREGDLDARGRFNSLGLEDRATLNVETEFLGKTTPRELDNIRRLQKKAKDDLAKGNQSSDADLQKTVRSIYNDLGLNGQTKVADKKRREVQGYMDSFVEKYRTDHAGKYPTRDELSAEAVKASGITKDSFFGGATYGYQEKPKRGEARPGDKVRVSDPNGRTFKVDAAGLDDWIAAHKGWKKL